MGKYAIGIVVMCFVFASGYWYGNKSDDTQNKDQKEIRQFNDGDFHFTNPLLECDLGGKYISQGKPRPSTTGLLKYIESQKQKGVVDEVSVYFRDLNNGPWVGINEEEVFLPASLLKVPVSMYFYKESERVPGLLDTTVVAPKVVYESVVEPYFKPNNPIIPGEKYSYRSLIEHAVRYSDNDAASILLSLSKGEHVKDLFSDLHLDLAMDETVFMSVKDYATFFRVLYNASYLNLENSDNFLQLLSTTQFSIGIRKYIPESITVAHKFGEVNLDASGQSELHDCGIVYYPSHPYIMCVMTKGSDRAQLAEVIAQISKMVYEEIDEQVR